MAYKDAVLALNPTGYWRLGENSGTTAADTSTSANTGTLHGGITLGITGLINDSNTAMTLDGIPFSYISIGNASSLQSSSGTLALLLKTTSNPGGNYQGLLVKQNAYGLFVHGAGHLVAYDWGSATSQDSGTVINDNIPHHVVFTYQSGVTNGSRLYVDGVAVGPAFTYTIVDQTQAMIMGAGDSTGFGQTFSGTLDEVAFYPVVLTAYQILNLYNWGIYGREVNHSKALNANQTFSGTLTKIRWYSGVFKFTSLGVIRAVYRTAKIITKNRNLT